MNFTKAFGKPLRGHAASFVRMALLALVVSATFAADPALARPDAGEEPPDGPIVYSLVPEEGAVVARDELGTLRVGATIETRHDGGISSAELFVDGRKTANPALMGPYTYLQSVSKGIAGLEPGEHTVRVTATDLEGRTGSHRWTFTVAGSASDAPSSTEEPPVQSTAVQKIETLPDTSGPALLLPVAALLMGSGLLGFALLGRSR